MFGTACGTLGLFPLAQMLSVSRTVVRDVAEDARRLKKQQTVDELLLFMAAL